MLAGDDHRVKSDRTVFRFVERATGRQGVTPAEAEALVIAAAQELSHAGVATSPRQLDYIIWNYQRSHPPPRSIQRRDAARRSDGATVWAHQGRHRTDRQPTGRRRLAGFARSQPIDA